MKRCIEDFSKRYGVIVGVCDSERLSLPNELKLLDVPFTTRDLDKRLDPRLTFAGAKSVIVIGAGYNRVCQQPSDIELRGKISRHAVGRDYHRTVAMLLERLACQLKSITDFNYKILVDNNPLCERALAVKAGLGYIGNNQAVISEKFGSYFNIGIMLTDLELEPNKVINKSCPKSCYECVKACPGGALGNGEFDYRKCVSYLTQKRALLSETEIISMGAWVYGCDACQESCPSNKDVEWTLTSEDNLFPLLNELINMDEATYKTRFEDSALYWRGREILARNAAYAKRNVSNGVLEF